MRRSGQNTSDGNGTSRQYKNKDNIAGFGNFEGLHLGMVVEIVDDRYEGYCYVEIFGQEQFSSKSENPEARKNYVRCRRAMPYGGSYQAPDHARSYGMSTHPPAPGTEVIVAFTRSNQEGIILGVLADTGRNSSYPDNAVSFVEDKENEIAPTFEQGVGKKQTKNTRPRHPLSGALANQGLGLDSVRGLSSSSARRESPSNVFGFNTPSGHSLVLDDGTVSKSERSLSPDPSRQAGNSNLVRLRSAGGAQMLFNDTAGIVYVINQAGNSWVQLSSDGKVDIYSSGDISMHTETDFNLHVGGDFNLDAECVNIKSRGECGTKFETVKGEFNLHSAKDIKFTTDLNHHLVAKGTSRTTAPLIDLNGPAATSATKTTNNNITVNKTVKQSITSRVPEAEPWGGHAEPQTPVASCASTNLDLKGVDIDLSNISNTNTDSDNRVGRRSGSGLSDDGFDSNATYQTYSSPGTSPDSDDDNVGMISDNNISGLVGRPATEEEQRLGMRQNKSGYISVKSATPAELNVNPRKGRPF